MKSPRTLIICLGIVMGLSLPIFGQTLAITNGIQIYGALTNTTVTMTGRCELRLTATTNPVSGCVINLNSPEAWFFLPNIRPSVVSAYYLGQWSVNGAPAVAGSNCRLDQFAMGSVIIPQAPSYTPLQVFSGQNLVGTTAQFGIYTYYTNSVLGVMNRNISSFRLKRGYQATFAQNADGTGASKVYVAQDGDLEVGVIQTNLDHVCSFVRVFPWRWTGKKGWVGGTGANTALIDPLWNYDYDNLATSTLDIEYVPMRDTAYWDDYANINSKQKSTEALAFNEPDQSNQANMTVADAIGQWPSLMQSGLRVGAPAVSSSGVSGQGLSWLYSFMMLATNLGYRIDYVPVHIYKCSLTTTQFSNYLAGIYQTTGRPLWVTEFNDTDFSSGCNQSQSTEASAITGYISMMESCPFVERYSVYEYFDPSTSLNLITTNNPPALTPAGVFYHNQVSSMALTQTIPPGNGRSIVQLQFETNALDGSGYGNNAFTVGLPSYTTGHNGKAVMLDGTNNFLQLPPNVANSAAFTFSGWIYWNGGTSWQRIFDFGNDTTHYLFLTPSSSSGTLRFAINNGSGEQVLETTGVPVGQWWHVAVTLGGGNVKIYTNGVLAASSGSFSILPSNFNPKSNYLGKSQFPADPLFRGCLDEVQIADTAFSASQIGALITNRPPHFTNTMLSLTNATQGQAYGGSFAGAASDTNFFNTLTYSKISGPAWLVVGAGGTVGGTPGNGDAGTNYFTVRATDFAGSSTYAQLAINVNGLLNPGFEQPYIPTYNYNPSGGAWIFTASSGSTGSGITANSSAFTTGNSNAPEGFQVAFLQGFASISQTVSMFVPGATYSINFAAAQRAQYQNGGQTWQVKIDNTVVGTFSPAANSTNYANYTVNFNATLGTHTLRFVGTDAHGGDNTVFIDNVRIGFVSPPAAPPAPVNLAAVAGDGRIALNWNAATFATGYNVKRSATSGSNYVTISSPPVTGYTDTGVTNGMTYYYVVSAFNSGGEGANSLEVVARPISMSVIPLNFSVNPGGLSLTFNWPVDHIGWRLLINTGALTDSNAWTFVPGTDMTNQLWLPVDNTQSNAFFRLIYP